MQLLRTGSAAILAACGAITSWSGSVRAQDIAGSPGAPLVPPQASSQPPQTKVHLEANVPDTQYFLRPAGDAGGYKLLCVAPCEARIPAGAYRMAVAAPGLNPVEVGDAVEVPGPATLRTTYSSNRGHRIIGWAIFADVTAGGIASLTWGLMQRETSCEITCSTGPNMASVFIGIASIVVGSAVGLPLALKRDQLDIEVVPDFQYAARASLPLRVATERAASPADAPGLAVRVTF